MSGATRIRVPAALRSFESPTSFSFASPGSSGLKFQYERRALCQCETSARASSIMRESNSWPKAKGSAPGIARASGQYPVRTFEVSPNSSRRAGPTHARLDLSAAFYPLAHLLRLVLERKRLSGKVVPSPLLPAHQFRYRRKVRLELSR